MLPCQYMSPFCYHSKKRLLHGKMMVKLLKYCKNRTFIQSWNRGMPRPVAKKSTKNERLVRERSKNRPAPSNSEKNLHSEISGNLYFRVVFAKIVKIFHIWIQLQIPTPWLPLKNNEISVDLKFSFFTAP